MCGIITIVSKDTFDVSEGIRRLKRLEYRGYDSYGFVTEDGFLLKKVGKIEETDFEKKVKIFIGHCLHPDTIVILDNKIEFVKNLEGEFNVISYLETSINNLLQIKLVKEKAKIFKHRTNKIIKIRIPFGELKVSPNHKIFVYDNGEIKEKLAKDIKVGDNIIILNKLEVEERKIKFKKVKNIFYIKPKNIEILVKKIKEYGISKLSKNLNIPTSYLNHIIYNPERSIRYDIFKKIVDFFDIKIEYEITKNPHGNYINQPSYSNKEIMEIIGYFVGDGTIGNRYIRFKDKNKELLQHYKDLIKKVFGIEGKITRESKANCYVLQINSKSLAKWFKKNVNDELLKKIPFLPKEEVASFIKGFFDADGFASTDSREIFLVSTNYLLIKSIQIALLRFGIHASFSIEKKEKYGWSDVYRLTISGTDINLFFENIGTNSKEKEEKIRKILGFTKINTKIINDYLSYQSVIEISEEDWNGIVYDLEVKNTEKFFAEGILNHNSRWATHGGVNEINAHPHTDCTNDIFVVHNGTIDNYLEIKEYLIKKGHKFKSETDSEIFAHLVEDMLKEGKSLKDIALYIFENFKGTYATIIYIKSLGKILAIKNGSPLVVGIKDDRIYIASDVYAFLDDTENVITLDDYEFAIIEK